LTRHDARRSIVGMTSIDRREAIRILGAGTVGLAGARWLGAATEGPQPPSNNFPGVMLERPIPSSGEKIPLIGLGTSRVFDVDGDPKGMAAVEEVLAAFVTMGGKLVDSSPMYGSAEKVVGDASAKRSLRPKLFVATKVWTTGKAKGIEQMEESERKLKAKPIDLIQVHNLVDVDTQLATLDAWKKEKRIRYTGITHYTASHHDEVAKVLERHTVDFVQINYSVAERDAERRLFPMAIERKIAIIANRPFTAGSLLARLKSKPLPSWAAEIDCTSWAQVLLKYVVSNPAVTCAIPATGNPEHLRDNMKAGYGRMPDEKLRARIAAEAV
jgi:diketogulonate reductase-like aldo/keto reductase